MTRRESKSEDLQTQLCNTMIKRGGGERHYKIAHTTNIC